MSKWKAFGLPFFAGMAGALVVVAIFGFINHKDSTDDQSYLQSIRNEYSVYSLPLPQQIDFCGEAIPLERWDVRERLDREMLVNTYWQSNTLLMIKRANKWFPLITQNLKDQGVPEDFKYLATIESGLYNAVSPSGAVGFWQFLEDTGKEYGLEINDEVDERYHVTKSTIAACAFFKEAYSKFGSWTMAAAAYNMGKGGVAKQTNRQSASNYWDLLLNEETSRYVLRIAAMKQLLTHPDQYGFVLRPVDLYPPLDFSKVAEVNDRIDDFAQWASDHNTNYKYLKIWNPWLRQSYLTNKQKKSYVIALPQDQPNN
jgi:hypothetical protein